MERAYDVFRGRKVGVYKTWVECNAQVHVHNGVVFCKYADIGDAEKAWANFCEKENILDEARQATKMYKVGRLMGKNVSHYEIALGSRCIPAMKLAVLCVVVGIMVVVVKYIV